MRGTSHATLPEDFTMTRLSLTMTKPSLPFSALSIHKRTIIVTSSWAQWRLKSSAYGLLAQPFVQAQIKENIKAPRHWPLLGESTDHRWIPLTKGQWRGKCFHLMTASCHTHQNTDTEKKWRPFCKLYFQIHLLYKNCCILIQVSLKCFPMCQINNRRAPVPIVTWPRTSEKPLPELMLTIIFGAIWRQMGHKELNLCLCQRILFKTSNLTTLLFDESVHNSAKF